MKGPTVLFLLLLGMLSPAARADEPKQTTKATPPATSKRLHAQRQLDQLLIDAIREDDVDQALWIIRKGANVRQRVTDYVDVELKESIQFFEEFARASETERDKRMNQNMADELKTIVPPTLLMYAAARGQKDIVAVLLHNGAPVNARGDFRVVSEGSVSFVVTNSTPLLLALENSHSEIAALLLRAGAFKEAKGGDGATPLLLAAANGDPIIVAQLLRAGAFKEARDQAGDTPLLRAILCGKKAIVKQLIQAKCNVNVADKYHKTPLMIAAEDGDREIYALLKKAGASENYPISDGGVRPGGTP